MAVHGGGGPGDARPVVHRLGEREDHQDARGSREGARKPEEGLPGLVDRDGPRDDGADRGAGTESGGVDARDGGQRRNPAGRMPPIMGYA